MHKPVQTQPPAQKRKTHRWDCFRINLSFNVTFEDVAMLLASNYGCNLIMKQETCVCHICGINIDRYIDPILMKACGALYRTS